MELYKGKDLRNKIREIENLFDEETLEELNDIWYFAKLTRYLKPGEYDNPKPVLIKS